jgi:hypothetical protein
LKSPSPIVLEKPEIIKIEEAMTKRKKVNYLGLIMEKPESLESENSEKD